MGNIDYDFIGSSSSADAAAETNGLLLSQSTLSILIIVIGACVVIALILSIVNLVMNIRLNRRIGNVSTKIGTIQTKDNDTMGVVFCKSCGSQFAATEKQCPYCGTRR